MLINLTDRIYSFLIFFLLAKYFSYNEYGEIITIFTLAAVISTFINLGLPIFIQREIARDKENASKIFSNIFVTNLILFIPYSLFAITSYFVFYSYTNFAFFYTICLTIYISLITNLLNHTLSGKFDFKHQFIPFLISRLYIIIFFVSGLFYFNFDLQSLLYIILIGFILHLILIFRFIDKNEIYLSIKTFDFRYIKLTIKITLPIGTAVIINYLYDKADVLLISKLLDFSKVALYNVGYGIFKTSTIAFSFILVSGFSRISFLSRKKSAISLFLKRYCFIVGSISIIIGIFLFTFASCIIHFFYSSKYDDSVIILRILSFGIIALGLNNVTGIILNGMGFFKTVLYITLFALFANILLNIFFIPLKGIVAASIITVLTEYFIFFIEYYYLKKVIKMKST